MNENIFRILAAIVLLSCIGISIWFRSKADRDSGEKVSWKDEGLFMILALRLGGLALWFSCLAYLINPAWMTWSKVGAPEPVRWLGAGVGALCIGLVYWLFSSIGSGISPTVATRTEHRLVTSGPYRWVRHPLYTAGTLLFLAFAMMADSWFIAALGVLAFILLAARVPNEEAHLIEKFGDEYHHYIERTGRFLPRLKA
jgi:protein-S-isoprenylcysteine O-methyltransferase Ste14